MAYAGQTGSRALNRFLANQGLIQTLDSNQANIAQLQSGTIEAGEAIITDGTFVDLSGVNLNVTNEIVGETIVTTTINATNLNSANLDVVDGTIHTLTSTSGYITNADITNLYASNATLISSDIGTATGNSLVINGNIEFTGSISGNVEEVTISNVESRIAANEDNIDTLQADLSDLSGRVFVNEGDIADISLRLFNTQGQDDTDLSDLSGRVESLEVFTADISNDYLRLDGGTMTGSLNVEQAFYAATLGGNVGIGRDTTAYKLDVFDDDVCGTNARFISNAQSSLRIGSLTGEPIDVSLWNDGDILGEVQFGAEGQLGGYRQYPASIVGVASSNYTTGVGLNNNIKGSLEFRVASHSSGIANDSAVRETKMKITHDGNVGINTLTPSQRLDVSGTTKSTHITSTTQTIGRTDISDTFNSFEVDGNARVYGELRVDGSLNLGPATVTLIDNGDGTLRLEHSNGTGMVFDLSSTNPTIKPLLTTNTNSKVLIDNTTEESQAPQLDLGTDSRVGIGTSDPSGSLHVSGDTYITNGKLMIGSTDTPTYDADIQGTLQAINSAYLATQSGNVGIGTTDPSNELHVIGTARIIDQNSTQTPTTYLGLGTPPPPADYRHTNLYIESGSDNGKITIANNTFASLSGSTMIDFDTKLSDYWKNITSFQSNTIPTAGRIEVKSVTYNNYEDADMIFYVARDPRPDGVGGTGVLHERMRILSTGNIGIGTSSPSYKLDVSGNARVYGEATFDSNVNITGDIVVNDGTINGGTLVVNNPANRTDGITISGDQPGITFNAPQGRWNVWSTKTGDTAGVGYLAFFDERNGGDYVFTLSNNEVRSYKNTQIDGSLSVNNNVGIGTNNPSYKLDVNGTTRSTHITSTTQTIGRTDISDAFNSFEVDGNARVYGELGVNNDVEIAGNLTLTAGNVITTRRGTGSNTYGQIQTRTSGGTDFYMGEDRTTSPTQDEFGYAMNANIGGGADLGLSFLAKNEGISSNAFETIATLYSSVNTTGTFTGKGLEVFGNTIIQDRLSIDPDASSLGDISIGNNTGQLSIATNKFAIGWDSLSGGWLQTFSGKPLLFNPLGNRIGIGTTNPGYTLDVNGNFRASNSVLVDVSLASIPLVTYNRGTEANLALFQNTKTDDGGRAGYIDVQNSGGTRALFGAGGIGFGGISANVLIANWCDGALAFHTNTTEKMRITSSGNVSIGVSTSNPDVRAPLFINKSLTYTPGGSIDTRFFDVGTSNDIEISNGITSVPDTSIFAEGNILSTKAFIASSDRRIKKEIIDISDDSALQTFRQLQPKTYKYIDNVNRTNENVYGFIAQEVRELIPNSVSIITNIIPDFYKTLPFDISENTLILQPDISYDIRSGDNIKIYIRDVSGNVHQNESIVLVEGDTLILDIDIDYDISDVFLYGKEVDDFHTLNKDAIWTVATAALQEVDRTLERVRKENHIIRGTCTLSNSTGVVVLPLEETEFTNPQIFLQNNEGWSQVKGSLSGNVLTIHAKDESCTDTIDYMITADLVE